MTFDYMTKIEGVPDPEAEGVRQSGFRPNFKTISFEIEAWFYAGQPYAEMPDWIRSRFSLQEMMERQIGRYALRDEDGEFYRWMDAEEFKRRYERINP